MLFLLVFPRIYLLGSLLVIISVTCLGSSFVILNSFLPLLVSNHPSISGPGIQQTEHTGEISPIALRSLSRREDESYSIDDYEHRPIRVSLSGVKLSSQELTLSTRISAKGVGIGYCAAVFVQLLSILLLFTLSKVSIVSSSASLPLRIVLFLVGLWWVSFTFLSYLWLRNRPGPTMGTNTSAHSSRWHYSLEHMVFAWVSLWKAIRLAVKLRQATIFLVAWFLLSDAIATMSGTAILFAKTELHMAPTAIAVVSIIATTSGIAGAFTWPAISKRLGLRPNQTILVCIAMFEFIPIYGLLYYIPFIRAWGFGGLQQAWEIYPLAFVHGFVMGGLSSYCRSFFGLLIPPGNEAAFYALYAITDKGSSVIGPAIVGLIVDKTGQIRPAFGFLAVIVLLPAPLIWLVDADRGRADGILIAESIGKFKTSDFEGPIIAHERLEEAEGLLADSD